MQESTPATLPSVSFTVPLFPPSVNHYKKPIIRWHGDNEGAIGFATKAEAKAYKQAIALFAPRGETLIPETKCERDKVRYGLFVTVIFGPRDRSDGDNLWKCLADGLKEAGIIHSDARVKVWHMELIDDERERGPCTEILVTVMPPRRRTMRAVGR